MSVSLSVRLPEKIMHELEEVANLLDRSKTYIVRKALEAYLEDYVDYLIAMERLKDKDDKIISARELREQLDL